MILILVSLLHDNCLGKVGSWGRLIKKAYFYISFLSALAFTVLYTLTSRLKVPSHALVPGRDRAPIISIDPSLSLF